MLVLLLVALAPVVSGDEFQVEGFPPPASPACELGPSDLIATRDGGNVKLTWMPGTVETSARVVRNGTELAAAAPVAPPEYIDATAPPSLLRYELTFDMPGEPCVLWTEYNGCIENLTAESASGQVELAWMNQLSLSSSRWTVPVKIRSRSGAAPPFRAAFPLSSPNRQYATGLSWSTTSG